KIGNRVQSNGKCLVLKYLKRGVAHTIYATDAEHPHFSFSIDFVPAIQIEKVIPFINKGDTYPWYAIPKPFKGKHTSCPANTFQLVNPDMEHKLLLDKQHLKVVYRLLKSLRDRYKLDKLKGAFLTSMFLWEIEKRSENFWQKPISELFLEDHLRKINELITIEDKDRKPYTDAYNEIRDTLLNGMCEMDTAFAQMYKGYRLFGSYMHNVRLGKPDEFDVLFILKVPFGEKLNVLMDDIRPGLMLEVLKVRFETRDLPYFWSSDHNLMDNLNDDEIAYYAIVLNIIFCTLETYPEQAGLTFHACARHFQILRHF
uniref:Mab-21 domain-containing protein n=1 Tax=Glossina austeni TaxID=7395 RepID=A0A1A9VQH3_GLOAU